MFRIVTCVVCVCLLSAAAVAQVAPPVSPDEAAKRLAEKQANRLAERSKPASITVGELEDLRAELSRVKAELAKYKSLAAANSPGAAGNAPAVKLVQKIAVGISRDELLRFVQVHKTTHEVVRTDPQVNGIEEIDVVVKAKHHVYTGVGSNGVNRFGEYHDELRPDTKLTVRLMNGTVSMVSDSKLPVQQDEINPAR